MYVLIGTRTKLKNEIWAGKATCPNCGQASHFHLYKLVQTITVFFIPTISITTKRYLICDSCEGAKELSKKEYKEAKKQQMQLLKDGDFPEDVIRNDFHPKKIHFAWRTIKLILSGLLLAIMILGNMGMITDLIADGESVFAAVLSSIGLMVFAEWILYIPFILSLKNFNIALKKKKAYASLQSE